MFQDPPDWLEILTHFRGSELQNFFTRLIEDDIKVKSLWWSMRDTRAVLTAYLLSTASLLRVSGCRQAAIR